ncbi:class I SAM-dependent methyltransferase [Buttiauxella sp. B2]|uniref:class I SAM-dependent methyltransferase n=1 Tax=Buttiauxella sp. B2 TaxID=2587812 RepID=UPI00111DF8A1|nr:class I SAM-dependent methyltransferase [Buttiauxella sp. B2]TNV20042.1 class I SAM-dependent methyltransferase [Buttiauxella sp. B2]
MSWQPFLSLIPGSVPGDLAIKHVTYSDISDDWPMKSQVLQHIDEINDQLTNDLTLEAPEVFLDSEGKRRIRCKNKHSEQAFRERPALEEWRCQLVPTALSLWAVQHPLAERLISGREVDSNSRSWFIHANDAQGVRSRAKVMAAIADNHINNSVSGNWVSLACGAAVPVLRTLRGAKLRAQKFTLLLIDHDRQSLKFARGLATQYGLVEGHHFQLLMRNLFDRMVASDKLVQELGEYSAELVDGLGIFEYFSAPEAVHFIRHALRLVKPGGVLIISNMLATSPQLAFLLRCIGWPTLYPRTLLEIRDIVLAAGVDLKNVTVTLPNDGVYAVLEINVV